MINTLHSPRVPSDTAFSRTGHQHRSITLETTTMTISSIFYFLLESLLFATLYITNNPHIGYGKHLVFTRVPPDAAFSRTDHQHRSITLKPTTMTIRSIFYFLLKSLLFVTLFTTNNPHIGYGKHLAFTPSTPRCDILENGSSTQVNHTETYYLSLIHI